MANDYVNFDRLRLSFQFSTNALRFWFFTKEAKRSTIVRENRR